MEFQLSEESATTLGELAHVSIAFEYDRILELTIVDDGLGGFVFTERHWPVSQRKDYDEFEAPGSWPRRFEMSNWGFLVARTAHEQIIGGAVIAFDTAGVDMLEGRRDLAVLWDLRVDPTFRGRNVGASLFHAAEKWCAARGCSILKVETQNTNFAACKFYARQGCTLAAINCLAYPKLPDEIQMIWYKKLDNLAEL